MRDVPHTIKGAMSLGELDEEEAYFVLRFAGHLGYREAIRRLKPWPWYKRARRWLVWFGGWEKPELLQWDRGYKAFEMKGSVYPLSFFDHAITFQRFGVDVRIPFQNTSLCIHRGGSYKRAWRGWCVYISPDCTPSSATNWFVGEPW